MPAPAAASHTVPAGRRVYNRAMRLVLPAVVTGLALLLPVQSAAQVSKGAAAAPGVTFQPGPRAPRSDAVPARDTSPRRDGDRNGATSGDLFLADEHTYAPRYDRLVPTRHHRRTPRIGARPYYLYDAEPFGTPVGAPRLPLPLSNADGGILKLQVDPPSAEVFIDGVSFRKSGLGAPGAPDGGAAQYLLEAGVHRVELAAEGFQPASFDVRISAGDTLVLSQQLAILNGSDQRVPPASGAVVRAAAKTLYVIPRCYAGDRKPDPAQLLPGCDLAKLRVIPPGR
jgi:hypothetical protein